MKKAIFIPAEGEPNIIAPQNGTDFTLEELQKAVDGYIEIVKLMNNKILVINDEGKFSKPVNQIASILAHMHKAISAIDYICGDVIFCPSEMVK